MGTTMAEIQTAINQINSKKQNLHESFLNLQSQSNFNLNWSDFDTHFTSIQSSLQSKFNLLQTLTKPDPETLVSLCRNSDGFGLQRFVANACDRLSIVDELAEAYRFASDPAGMVLEVVDGFNSSGFKGNELRVFRRSCLVMLEGLMRVKSDVGIGLKYKAMEMAVEWNRCRGLSLGSEKGKEENAFGFLLLVGAYGLIDGFSMDEVIDCFVDVVNKPQVFDLCRQIIPANYRNDLIRKLVNKDMHITAVKFSIELDITDEFSPIGLLEERKLKSISVIERARQNNEVIMKEISTLKAIIKCIDEHHLKSQYPKDSLVELVNKLENEVRNKKEALVKEMGFRKINLSGAPSAAQASGLSSDHVSKHHDSSVRIDFPAPYRLTGRNTGYSNKPVPADAGPIFFVPWSHPPSNDNSNGWISE